MTPEQRATFEQLATTCDLEVTRFEADHGDYAMSDTRAAWKVYEAALASDTRRSVEEMENAIAAGMVNYTAFREEHDWENGLISASMVATLSWVCGISQTEPHFQGAGMLDEAVDNGRTLRTSAE